MKYNAIIFAAAFVSFPAFAQTTGVVCATDHFVSMSPLGNEIFHLAVDGTLGATLSEFGEIEIWDLSDPNSPLSLTMTTIPDGPTNDITLSNTTIAVSFAFADIVHLVDASDPNNPILRGSVLGESDAIDIEADSLYILSNGQIRVFDISNLDTPILLGTSAGVTTPRDVQVDGDRMYVADFAIGLRIFDVSNPASIIEVGQLATAADSVSVNGTTAVITAASVTIIDVTNPALPQVTSSISEAASSSVIKNNQLYLSNRYGISVFDISNLQSPVYQRLIAGPEILSNPSFAMSQGNIIIGGAKRLVVSDSSITGQVSSEISNAIPAGIPPTADLTAMSVQDGFGYTVDADSGSLLIIDLSNPVLPNVVGSLLIGSNIANDLVLSGNTAFLMSDATIISVVDISDPTSPSLTAAWDATPPGVFNGSPDWWGNFGLEISGTTLYICPITGGFAAFDVTNPVAPIFLSQEPWNNNSGHENHAFTIGDNRAAVVWRSQPGQQATDLLRATDISAPSSPIALGSSGILTLGLSDGGLQISGTTAYVTAGTDFQGRLSSSFGSFDISSLPFPLNSILFATPSEAFSGGPGFQSFVIQNSVAYVLSAGLLGSRSISVFDISDPSSLNYLGSTSIESPASLYGVSINGDRLYAVGGTTGRVSSYDISSCQQPCPADLTGDGNLNFFDVSAFLSAYSAQDPAADFTNDGLFNFFDVSAFLTAYAAGCP